MGINVDCREANNVNDTTLESESFDSTPSPVSRGSVPRPISPTATTDPSPISMFRFSSLTINPQPDFEDTCSNSPLPFMPRLSLLTLDNDDYMELEIANENYSFNELGLENDLFVDIVRSLNSDEDRYEMKSLSAGTNNEVYRIYDRIEEKNVAIFKTVRPNTSGSKDGARHGVGSGTEFAFINEVIAHEISNLLSDRKIIPEARIVSLKNNEVYRKGTLHEFIDGDTLKTDVEIKNLETEEEKNRSLLVKSNFFNLDSPEFVETIQDIAATHIVLGALDANPGSIIISNNMPVSIDYNEIASTGFEVGIKPPVWLDTKACSKPFKNKEKIEKLELEALTDTVQTIEGHSPKGLLTMQFGCNLLKKGIAKELTLNEMAYFLIGYSPLANAPRSAPAMADIYNACLVDDKINQEKLDSLLDESMNYVIENRERNKIDSLPGKATHIEKIAIDLKTHLETVLI